MNVGYSWYEEYKTVPASIRHQIWFYGRMWAKNCFGLFIALVVASLACFAFLPNNHWPGLWLMLAGVVVLGLGLWLDEKGREQNNPTVINGWLKHENGEK